MCVEMMCRVWDITTGKQLCSLQGHKGRGVWRCLLHPNQDLLITAGADSSIKVWRLADWLPADHPLAAQASDAFSLPPLPVPATAVAEAAAVDCAAEAEAAAGAGAHATAAPLPASSSAASRAAVSSAGAEVQARQAGALEPSTTLAATAAEGQVDSARSQPGQQDRTTPDEPKAAAASKGRDSKLEWVRCLKLADESTLFVGTNLGCLYSVSLPSDSVSLPSDGVSPPSDSVSLPSDSSSSSPEWHLLYSSPRKAAITSLQAVHPDAQANPQGVNAPAAQHSTAGSISAEAGLPNRWVVFGDIQGVVTCLRTKQADVRSSKHQSSPTSHSSASSHDQSQLQLASQDDSNQSTSSSMTGNQATPQSKEELWQPGGQQLHGVCSPSTCASWIAHSGKPVLKIFTVPAFGPRHVFSTTVTGTALRWWLMPEPASLSPSPVSSPSSASSLSGSPGQVAAAGPAKLLAEIRGPAGRGSQIVALDACPKRGLLMCGDMIGTVMGFAVPSELLQNNTAGL